MSSLHLELLYLAQDRDEEKDPSHLLNRGANPNIRDIHYKNWTPLHYSVFLRKENFALMLIEHEKCNPQSRDSEGFSALYWSCKRSTPKVTRALLDKGCDPNEHDVYGMTPLFAAVSSNKKGNVEALLSHPLINVNQRNQFGGSALHHTAFVTGNIKIAELLLNAGADLFLKDYANRTPLDVAKLRKRKGLLEYFMVFMFAKNAEMLFEDQKSTYYTIPSLVIHRCAQYYSMEQ